jgi:hypothetical protein
MGLLKADRLVDDSAESSSEQARPIPRSRAARLLEAVERAASEGYDVW